MLAYLGWTRVQNDQEAGVVAVRADSVVTIEQFREPDPDNKNLKPLCRLTLINGETLLIVGLLQPIAQGILQMLGAKDDRPQIVTAELVPTKSMNTVH